ncbi:hypothetical protein RhiirA4_470740 [Rhizophagus irregularis]|uniref:Uncharacterized protein n=1 Tax=Rhizophagus irregularis TaxID=588596 RepID=A0A2I1H1T6_9GLOM|nr:hypothetical protein RhiirA4_470740 [Rhizophagus irregularis]
MAYDNNNRSQVDYLKIKQLINNIGNKTIQLTSGEDLAPYEALLSEFQDVLRTFIIWTDLSTFN